LNLAFIGGGAAGFFGSIICAQANPKNKVILFEKSRQLLTKVRISGGGRCNVTHSCFDPKILVQNYPRGSKALLGPFTKFQPRDTIQWFESRGVKLKTEADGRMFPITDNSSTIIDCLTSQAKISGVEIRTGCGVEAIKMTNAGFILILSDGNEIPCDKVLVATGSSPKVWDSLKALGHTIVPPVPSLFTFNVPDSPLVELAGISVPKANAKVMNTPLEQSGPLLITHWGFSGPAILKLSAWGARILNEKEYRFTLQVNWLPDKTVEELRNEMLKVKENFPARLVMNEGPPELPRNLWKKLAERAGVTSEMRWSGVSKTLLQAIIQELKSGAFECSGKSTYKDEFVTSGGVALGEVDFKTMQSKLCSGLHFAGEVLDIDGVTGGFNFQNAWTTAWIAGGAMGGEA